jgi:hypothetical protein
MALFTCVVIMAVLVTTSGISLSLALARRAAAKQALEVDHSYLVAEAGVARSLYEMQLNADTGVDGVGNSSGQLAPGAYTTTVAPAFAGPGEYTIQSIGTVQGVRRGISAVVRQQVTNIGLFAANSITMSGGLTDSYNSNLGSYASQVVGTHANPNGTLATNGNISISGSANIWGNATPGPLGIVSGTVSGVHGSTAPAAAPVVVPPYVYAPPIPATGALSVNKTFTSGTYHYTAMTAGGGVTWNFTGDVTIYCDNKFTISGSGIGNVAPGAHVTIHQGTNDFTISGSGVINQDQKPANLTIYSASLTKVTVSGSAAFYGTIRAPNAAMTVSGSGGYYGGMQAKALTISGGATMHYDEALGVAAGGFQLVLKRTFRP